MNYTFEYNGQKTNADHTPDTAEHWAKEYVKHFKKSITFYPTDDESCKKTIDILIVYSDCMLCNGQPDWVVKECQVCGGEGKLIKA